MPPKENEPQEGEKSGWQGLEEASPSKILLSFPSVILHIDLYMQAMGLWVVGGLRGGKGERERPRPKWLKMDLCGYFPSLVFCT